MKSRLALGAVLALVAGLVLAASAQAQYGHKKAVVGFGHGHKVVGVRSFGFGHGHCGVGSFGYGSFGYYRPVILSSYAYPVAVPVVQVQPVLPVAAPAVAVPAPVAAPAVEAAPVAAPVSYAAPQVAAPIYASAPVYSAPLLAVPVCHSFGFGGYGFGSHLGCGVAKVGFGRFGRFGLGY